jgi:glycosyltransferase involved in cell wall biosynthesis
MRVSHIIATKGRPGLLRAVLESSTAALTSDDEVIIVDGDPTCSGQPVVEKIQVDHPGAELRYLPSAPGSALQRNVGIDAARGDIVIFTDDDCTFPSSLFDALAAVYDDSSLVGVTGRIIEEPRPRLGSDTNSRLRWLLVGGGREGGMTRLGMRCPILRVNDPHDVEFMPGPFMSTRRWLAVEIRFDERLTGYGLGEDNDFSYRLSRRGRVRYEPSLHVNHHEIGFRTMDPRERDRLQISNRIYLFRKNFSKSFGAKLGFVMLIMMMFVHRALNREWDGLRGLAEGLWQACRHDVLELGPSA